ncbi:hypothetical protein [Shewanella fodinae]|uniref:hypothetical protein n=1 Tax=Shewanella fodinae TaxID=552357 RepID=UPI001672E14A|nr:hypothetical protein [Shewanella fodinae]MCL2905914.1 hypothetical protein [Shewanella fodinae]GGY95089.1 hypothetical protein GCM10007169_10120 [Shewanella fodinae]
MSRKQAMKQYNQLYKRSWPVSDELICQCCGNSTNLEWDHCPAITTAHLFINNKKIKFILVLLCKECNLLLSNLLIPDFPSRFYYVKDELIKKYEKNLINERGENVSDFIDSEFDCSAFSCLLGRISFGLLRFDQLSDNSQIILEKITVSGITVMEHLINSSNGKLIHESNLIEEDEVYHDEDGDLPNLNKEEVPFELVTFLEGNRFSLNGFKLFLHDNYIYTQSGYNRFYDENVIWHDYLPVHPEKFFNCDWNIFLDVFLISDKGSEFSLNILEKYITYDFVERREKLSLFDLEDLLNDLKISTKEEYNELIFALGGRDIIAGIPDEPENFYEDWILW